MSTAKEEIMVHNTFTKKNILALLVICATFTASKAQYGDFGMPDQPADTASVDDIIYYGDVMDMTGGYDVNDTVSNFTLYDFDGNPVELYEQLAGPKPVVVVSGSVSCIRFRNVFDPSLPGQEVLFARNFIYDHIEDYNWIFVYGVEAHPTDGNCPSNCPPTVNTDTAVVQPSIYAERRWAMHDWLESPIHDFPLTMYADNPDNAVYNNFFQRPFGMIALNCDGTVGIRADWVTSFFGDTENVQSMLDFRQEYLTCTIDWQPEEEEEETEDEISDDETSDDDTSDDETDDGDIDDETSDDETDDGDIDDDEPVDASGPNHAFEGHDANEVASILDGTTGIGAIVVYPNPARSTFTVASDALNALWKVTDIRGCTMAEWTQSNRLTTLEVSHLPRGQYVLIGRSADGSTTHHRLILQ